MGHHLARLRERTRQQRQQQRAVGFDTAEHGSDDNSDAELKSPALELEVPALR